MIDFWLNKEDYTLSNALFWGNCSRHWSKAQTGTGFTSVVHYATASAEAPPIIGQIFSIIETCLAALVFFLASKLDQKKIQVTVDNSNEKPQQQQQIQQLAKQELQLEKDRAAPTQLAQIQLPTKEEEQQNERKQRQEYSQFISTSWKPLASIPQKVRELFQSIRSNLTVPLPKGLRSRADFLQSKTWSTDPVIIGASEFIPPALIKHLMINKADVALNTKYKPGTKITNVEGAAHSFVTAVCPITMVGDYCFQGTHCIQTLPQLKGVPQGRQVILSTAIQPDFEKSKDPVVKQIIGVQKEAIEGKPLSEEELAKFKCLWEESAVNEQFDQKLFQEKFPEYESILQRHLVYHLTSSHRLPSQEELLKEQSKYKIFEWKGAISRLEECITKGDASSLMDQYVEIQIFNDEPYYLSLEAFYNFYIHQLRNEFSILEQMLTQGYVYTIDPPSIFVSALGGASGAELLNRLQILAFQHLNKNVKFNNLRCIGFNDYIDKGAIPLLQRAFSENAKIVITSKNSLFQNKGFYSVNATCALVVHNNSDAFGQNIENEGYSITSTGITSSSLDGALGGGSNGAGPLARNNKNLLQYVV